MSILFTAKDLKIFEIPTFPERMEALKNHIRPKLESFGEMMSEKLTALFRQPFFAHTAKHMRRRVNPPDETWVALGPEKRGYKAYVYFALGVGKAGLSARVVMKDESALRRAMADNLMRNLKTLQQQSKKLPDLADYGECCAGKPFQPIVDFETFATREAERLKALKSACFDIGVPLKQQDTQLAESFEKSASALFPFFLCGLRPEVKL